MVKYYPIHISHIVLGLIWASSLIAINYIEFALSSITGINLFWIVIQNSVISTANSYWLIKTHITPQGAEIESSNPTPKQ